MQYESTSKPIPANRLRKLPGGSVPAWLLTHTATSLPTRQLTQPCRPSALLNLQKFHLERQLGVGWDDIAGTLLAVGELRRDDQLPLAADLHAGDALVPALDDHALAERKAEGLAAID